MVLFSTTNGWWYFNYTRCLQVDDAIDVAVRSGTNVILNPSGEEIETDNLGNVLEISGEHEWDATLHDDAVRVNELE